ncbi:hypothetical protein J7F02_32900 [Streptomyces sp. ISL-112]|uniref:hypothetical protein n=1 Tax=unclassified Streptomyces TaxID=2593676 RepID=UPI001BE6272D|nr:MULTISPECIES: hypothetical protein [unclassified Streptomyces]MBT2430261.1 hypothetical protein [Streptomyces sp. ISL-112]MBT2462897.1 hypothetical protein [Streptomyces sp. ISL-63]
MPPARARGAAPGGAYALAGNPAAPAGVLLRVPALNDRSITYRLSYHPALPGEVAEAMLTHPERWVRHRLGESFTAAPELRARLLDGPASRWRSRSAPTPTVSRRRCCPRRAAARDPRGPVPGLLELLADPGTEMAAAANPALPPAEMAVLPDRQGIPR